MRINKMTSFAKILDLFVGNRLSADVEVEGLDVPAMGVEGYAGYLAQRTDGRRGA